MIARLLLRESFWLPHVPCRFGGIGDKAMRRRIALQSTACEMHQERWIRFGKALGVRTRLRVAFIVELQRLRPERLWFGRQPHD